MHPPRAPRPLPVEDSRLSPEFGRRLARYMGEYDPTSPSADRYADWYRDHAGRRSQWFRTDLVPRLERHRLTREAQILDFGCGTGSSMIVLAERGARVVGAETEQVSLDVAAQRIRDLDYLDRCALVRIPYLTGRSHLPFADRSFDVCTLIGVLEHMRPAERVTCVAEIHRVVRPGGRVFVFDTPNRLFPKDLHTTLLWFMGWLPHDVARWYAVRRGRFDPSQDFQRYGANGVSRREIDRIFPSRLWATSYEKPRGEVVQEYAQYLSTGPASRVWRVLAAGLLRVIVPFGGRPATWTASHTLELTKR